MLGCSMAGMNYLGREYEQAAEDDQGPGMPTLTARVRGVFQKAANHVKGWSIPVPSTTKPSFA